MPADTLVMFTLGGEVGVGQLPVPFRRHKVLPTTLVIASSRFFTRYTLKSAELSTHTHICRDSMCRTTRCVMDVVLLAARSVRHCDSGDARIRHLRVSPGTYTVRRNVI
jgi:hypothetical protein